MRSSRFLGPGATPPLAVKNLHRRAVLVPPPTPQDDRLVGFYTRLFKAAVDASREEARGGRPEATKGVFDAAHPVQLVIVKPALIVYVADGSHRLEGMKMLSAKDGVGLEEPVWVVGRFVDSEEEAQAAVLAAADTGTPARPWTSWEMLDLARKAYGLADRDAGLKAQGLKGKQLIKAKVDKSRFILRGSQVRKLRPLNPHLPFRGPRTLAVPALLLAASAG